MDPAPSQRWLTTSASLKGSSHGADSPNQDAVRVEVVRDESGRSTWIAAVADGHGGSRYVRSDVGARTAVDVAIAKVTELLAAGRGEDPDLLRGAAPLMVDAWRAAVLAHVAAHPFMESETAKAGASVSDSPVLAYGATLLVAVVNDAGVRLSQIGDGDALVRTHGFAVRPIPGDARLIANETTSLCLDSAATDFRFAELPSTAEVDLVLLASDGYGNSFAAQDWWHTLVGDVAWYVDVHGFDEFSKHLPDWLAESALVGGDDVTTAVLSLPVDASRPAAVIAGGMPSASNARTQEQAESQTPTAAPSPERRRSRGGIVAAVLVGVLAVVGTAVGLVWLDRDQSGPVTPPTSPSSTLSPNPTPSVSPSPSDKPKKKKRNANPDDGAAPAEPDGDDGAVDAPPNPVPDRPRDDAGTPKDANG